MFPWQQIGSGLGGLFGSFGGGNPADGSQRYLDQIPGMFDPYRDAGLGALPQLQQQFGMGADPSQVGDILSQLGAGYQQSPGFQHNMDQALLGVDRAASAGGSLGTPGAMTAAAGAASGIASQDYNQYLNNALGLRSEGLNGLQNLYGTGFNATQGQANALQSQAQLEYARQAAENQRRSGLGGAIGGIIGGIGGGLFG